MRLVEVYLVWSRLWFVASPEWIFDLDLVFRSVGLGSLDPRIARIFPQFDQHQVSKEGLLDYK